MRVQGFECKIFDIVCGRCGCRRGMIRTLTTLGSENSTRYQGEKERGEGRGERWNNMELMKRKRVWERI